MCLAKCRAGLFLVLLRTYFVTDRGRVKNGMMTNSVQSAHLLAQCIIMFSSSLGQAFSSLTSTPNIRFSRTLQSFCSHSPRAPSAESWRLSTPSDYYYGKLDYNVQTIYHSRNASCYCHSGNQKMHVVRLKIIHTHWHHLCPVPPLIALTPIVIIAKHSTTVLSKHHLLCNLSRRKMYHFCHAVLNRTQQ